MDVHHAHTASDAEKGSSKILGVLAQMANDGGLGAETLGEEFKGLLGLFGGIPQGDGAGTVVIIPVVLCIPSDVTIPIRRGRRTAAQHLIEELVVDMQNVVNEGLILALQNLHSQKVGADSVGAETL